MVDTVSRVHAKRCLFSLLPPSNPTCIAFLTFIIVYPFGIDLKKPFVPVNTSYSSTTYFDISVDPYLPGTILGALWVDKFEKIYKSAAPPLDEPD